MTLDLSALEAVTNPKEVSDGKPLNIPLSQIEEDPNQPRKDFDKRTMDELVSSVAERGIKSPVSVRKHPDMPDKWLLNFGARRLRACRELGLATIPAFIDEKHNDYDQVIENLQRDNLKPMELAIFIQKKMGEGHKQVAIAKNLGVHKSAVTHHLALIGMPDCLEEIYRSGKCKSAITLYELRALYDGYPEEVKAFCDAAPEITRKAVATLSDTLKGIVKVEVPPEKRPDDNTEQADQENIGGTGGAGRTKDLTEGLDAGAEPATKAPRSTTAADHGEDDDDAPAKIKKPLLIVDYDERQASVLLNRKPTTEGLLHIKFEDDGQEIEVAAADCRINMLIEQ